MGTGSARIAAWSEEEYLARGHAEMLAAIEAEAASATRVERLRRRLPPGRPLRRAPQRGGPARPHRHPPPGSASTGSPGPRPTSSGSDSLPDPDQERLAAAGVTVLVVPGATHAMTVEAPDDFARLVGGFLDAAPEGRPPSRSAYGPASLQ